jgi:hypothetical protein
MGGERDRAKVRSVSLRSGCQSAGSPRALTDGAGVPASASYRSRANSAPFRRLSEFERRDTVNPVWSKRENWRIAAAMTGEEVRTAGDLDEFLVALAEEVEAAG